jgi:hypothetical protein
MGLARTSRELRRVASLVSPGIGATRRFSDARWIRGDDRYLPFGPDRPFTIASRPSLGRQFQIQFWPFYLKRHDDTYDLGRAWIILSLRPPLKEPVVPLGPGALWFDLQDPSCLVWSFGGQNGYSDFLFRRDDNGRCIVARLTIPESRELSGARVWLQMLRLSRKGEWSGGHILQVTLGEALY